MTTNATIPTAADLISTIDNNAILVAAAKQEAKESPLERPQPVVYNDTDDDTKQANLEQAEAAEAADKAAEDARKELERQAKVEQACDELADTKELKALGNDIDNGIDYAEKLNKRFKSAVSSMKTRKTQKFDRLRETFLLIKRRDKKGRLNDDVKLLIALVKTHTPYSVVLREVDKTDPETGKKIGKVWKCRFHLQKGKTEESFTALPAFFRDKPKKTPPKKAPLTAEQARKRIETANYGQMSDCDAAGLFLALKNKLQEKNPDLNLDSFINSDELTKLYNPVN